MTLYLYERHEFDDCQVRSNKQNDSGNLDYKHILMKTINNKSITFTVCSSLNCDK